MTDAELVRAFSQQGDAEAFALVVERYEKLVWRLCASQLPHRCDQEDAFQTTFLLLAENVGKIRKPSSLGSWLYGTARKVASRIRKQRTLPTSDVRALQIPSPSPSAFETIARQYELDVLDRQIQAMPERDRTPLILLYFAGFSAKQIANQLNLTPEATDGRIRRARTKLRKLLRGEVVGILALVFAALTEAESEAATEALVQVTVERCVSTGASAVAGTLIATSSHGVRMMICKSVCAAGIAAILTLGSLLGVNATTTSEEVAVVVQAANVDAAEIAFESGGEVQYCPLMQAVTVCCDFCSSASIRACSLHEAVAEFASRIGESR